jgi:diguanylate cyclase (GGDEF)-like protein
VRVQQQLQHTAFHDALTGLPNRDLFRSRLVKAMEEARRNQRVLAVLFMDLDRFKAINDSLGHSVGDELLVLAAKRIRHCVRETDLVCRLGGDEFTALLPNLDGVQAARVVAAKILDALTRPFHIQQHQMRVSASVGIALFPDHGDSVEEILKNADTAMYQAKEGGRNNAQVYAAEMNAKAGERLRMAFALQLALERDEYRIAYQPKLRLGDGRVVGVEALLRWHSSELGTVGPGEFVPQLEDSGAIVEVGRWVLKNAVLQARRWQDAGQPLSVAVNVSAVQFGQAGLVSDIAALLQESGLQPALLQIELTESLLMSDMQRSAFVIGELTRLGVQLALDDFGTGYSSLGYLRRFAVQELKIDRSFVQEIDTSPAAARIVKTVIDLGHALGMTVTAEGVETAAQAALLREMACDLLQGYWLARPMSLDLLESWLLTHQPTRA